MSQGEVIIAFLLAVIAWLLYQIAKQLSYLTGRRIKLSIFNKELYNDMKRKFAADEKKKREKDDLPTRLPN